MVSHPIQGTLLYKKDMNRQFVLEGESLSVIYFSFLPGPFCQEALTYYLQLGKPYAVKKAPFLITMAILATLVGGYYLYSVYVAKKSTSVWDLVPSATVAVYEPSGCEKCTVPVFQSPIGQLIEAATFYNKSHDSLRLVMEFIRKPSIPGLVSLHVITRDDFDFVYYRSFQKPSDKALFDNAVLETQGKGYRLTEREFNGVKIHELTGKGSVFSWVVLNNAWVGSFTPFLVEDVIRTFQAGPMSGFRATMDGLYALPRIKADAGNLYVHFKNLSTWFSSFYGGAFSESIRAFGNGSLLDMKHDKGNLVLNGFSMDLVQNKSFLSLFKGQSPVPFTLKPYISNRTALMLDFGISDGVLMEKSIQGYFEGKRKRLNDSLAKVTKRLLVDVPSFYSHIHDEVAICYLESKGGSLSKVLLLETKEPQWWMERFTQMAEKESADTLFHEPYSSYEIRELPLYHFPEKLLWPLVGGFKSIFFTVQDNVVLMAEEVDDLKKFLDDIDREETWGKSMDRNRFIETTLLESNISLYFNSYPAWNLMLGALHPKWKQFAQDQQHLIKALDMGSLQFSHLNESFYTNFTLASHEPQPKAYVEREQQERLITNFGSGILGPLFLVKSHVDKSDEILVQDSTYAVQLVSSTGKSLWKTSLDGPMMGGVEQIDYFNNGKLQFLFATPGRLHVIDRLGNDVKPYPLDIPVKEMDFISVIDYDHSKKYRFLLADRQGALWIFDKEGKNLDGWGPRKVEGGLFVRPRHHRIRGKDYLLAMRKDGRVYLMNRRGEDIKGFPLKLDTYFTGDYFLETGKGTADTYFVLLSKDGFRIKFNLEGKVISRETLVKTEVDSRFSMVAEKSGKSYIIVRQDRKRLSILDEGGKEWAGNDFVGNNPIDVKYYDFGAGEKVLSITDKAQELTYIYNKSGQLLTPSPLESHGVALVPGKDGRIKSFTVFQKNIVIQYF